MGWASGSDIAIKTIKVIQKEVKDPASRKRIYEKFYNAMTDKDWDTVDEAMGIDYAFDEVAKENGWGLDDDFEDGEF